MFEENRIEYLKPYCNGIYDILVKCAGAPDSEDCRDMFNYQFGKMILNGRGEYRFQGKLGFGGKIYFSGYDFQIGYYSEDHTKQRLAIVRETTNKLDEFLLENPINEAIFAAKNAKDEETSY